MNSLKKFLANLEKILETAKYDVVEKLWFVILWISVINSSIFVVVNWIEKDWPWVVTHVFLLFFNGTIAVLQLKILWRKLRE
jgi:hypothetical protein